MKFSLNRTNSQNKANSENTVTLYKIIVFSYPYGAYYHSDILELLRWNPHFTPLRPKRWPIWTMLSDASKPSFLASLTLVTVRATFWSCYSKILTEPHYNPKDSQFKKYCHTPLNHRFQLVIMGLSSERHFGDLTMKSSLNSITTQILTYLQTAVRRLQIISFPLLSQCLSSQQYFAALTVKCSLNCIRIQKMASFQNTVTRLWIIVFS